MENANGYEYLEKIKVAVIENLKRTAHVPSVQMQDVPRQSLGVSDEQEAEMDDNDEDENKDVRLTQRQWEKRVERDDEFEESDDEDLARTNGSYKAVGRSRQDTDFRNAKKDDDAMDIDSGVATPGEQPAAEAVADNDDTMIDEALAEVLAEEEKADAEKRAAQEQVAAEGEKTKVDGEGDVDMAEPPAADDKATEATIKKEEVEGISATEAEPTKTPPPDKVDTAAEGNDTEAPATKQRASASPEAAGEADAKPAEEAAAAEPVEKKAAPADTAADDGEVKA